MNHDYMRELIMKNIGEQGQADIQNLESELAKRAAKIKTTEDMIEKGCKYKFLVIVLEQTTYRHVVRNPTVQWVTPKHLGGYDETIHAKTYLTEAKGKRNMQGQFLSMKSSQRWKKHQGTAPTGSRRTPPQSTQGITHW